ncbi:hypothetical protein [Lacticaseibacillus paracasei]|uniref:hypothetical protein n=1 Tax=Lacticaseibacillus paracasei TaxID=1597 RepID=UPI0021C424F4|nr:hypothetical protein [Lacticaseibacillus paracasei]
METFTPISSQDISDSKNKIKILEQNLNTQFSAFQITLMGLLMPLILLRIQEMNTISSNEYRDILQIISKDDYQRIRIAMKKTHVFEAGLKSIFETDFKRHSEPRLPSTAQINH